MPSRLRLAAFLALEIAGLVSSREFASAADPMPYTVDIAPSGDEEVDKALADSSNLVTLRETGPVGSFALIIRARQDVDRLGIVLGGLGYYAARVTAAINDRPLDDPDLPDLLDHAPANPPAKVRLAIVPGRRFHLGQVEIHGQVPDRARAAFALSPGTPAIAADVLAARSRLLSALREDGFALAKVDQPIAILRPSEDALDIAIPVETGPRVNLGEISVNGLGRMNESFVRDRLLLRTGERFSSSRIEAARQDLLALGVFSSVRITPPDALDPAGQLPLAVDVSERPLRVVDFGVSWSTDLGGNATASWQHRNLFGNAEQLTVSGGVNNLGGTAARAPGYNATVKFLKPDFLQRDQSLQIDIAFLRQELDAYTQTASTAAVLLNRKLSPRWTVSGGVSFEQERILQQGVTRDYTLLDLPLTARYDNTDNLMDPTHGSRLALSVTPTWSIANSTAFVLLQAAGSTYFDLGSEGRSILALRGLIGNQFGAGQFSLPPDRRLYAGGSATVRGYRFQSIGPQFPDGDPTGGTAVAAGGMEFRQRFLESWGAVAFVDAGQVSATGAPFTGTWRAGAGVGVRYYTSFGPIRVDFAVPVNPPRNADKFGIYVGIGQAF